MYTQPTQSKTVVQSNFFSFYRKSLFASSENRTGYVYFHKIHNEVEYCYCWFFFCVWQIAMNSQFLRFTAFCWSWMLGIYLCRLSCFCWYWYIICFHSDMLLRPPTHPRKFIPFLTRQFSSWACVFVRNLFVVLFSTILFSLYF